MTEMSSFQTVYSVYMECKDCENQLSNKLRGLMGVDHFDIDLKRKLISVRGIAAPSSIVKAIEETGRDALLRGSGEMDCAAVCILETHEYGLSMKVRGLCRIVQVSPGETLFDLSVRGLAPGRYFASIRQRGDIRRGALSTGPIWDGSGDTETDTSRKGYLGCFSISALSSGSLLVQKPIQVWETIGRSILVSSSLGSDSNGSAAVVGVVARSAGAWENEKMICSCNGNTIWEERGEQLERGML